MPVIINNQDGVCLPRGTSWKFGFWNRGVCLLRGMSWIFVWLFKPTSVFSARYELNRCVQYWLIVVFIQMLVDPQIHNPEACRVVEMKSEVIFFPPNSQFAIILLSFWRVVKLYFEKRPFYVLGL